MIALKNILVATDFGEASEAALLYGRNLARTYDATLHVLHVADDLSGHVGAGPMAVPPDLGHLQMELETQARKRLAALLTDEDRTTLRGRVVLRVSPRPADVIVSYARDEFIDLIIVGTHGRTGLSQFFLGSVAQHVARMAPCPVLTVRHPERDFVHPDERETVIQGYW